MLATDVAELLDWMTPAERAEFEALMAADRAIWRPLPGPQTMAYNSDADIIGYGGAAGGGKTDLMCGKMLTRHRRGMILRRIGTEVTAIEDRFEELIGDRKGYNGQKMIWRTKRVESLVGADGKVVPATLPIQIEFGSVPNAGDEKKYQGRPHDFLGFDEAANFLEAQVRFLLGWLRSVTPGQRCQALLAFNPPTSAEGRWIISFFAPWLDDKHPNPAKPGELRWFATVEGGDLEVEDGREFVMIDGVPTYEFRRRDHAADAIIRPLSRTFIPSRISDNPYLMGTGYMATLQSLPEPLRSQMLKGDFKAGMEDDAFQVIPTAWVDAAMDRWKPKDQMPRPVGPMDTMGVDVAAGGRDKEVIARRHGTWFDELIVYPGLPAPDGSVTGSRVISHRRDQAVVHVDVIGPGGPTHGFLSANGIQSVGIDSSRPSDERSVDGNLPFFNLRSEMWWRMREALDPKNPNPIALPDDSALRADLTAPKWLYPGCIRVEAKADTKKRLGRSPDRGDAVIYALVATMKRAALEELYRKNGMQQEHNPFAALDRVQGTARDYDPFTALR